MPTVTLARHAMATRFELVLHGDSEVALRAAGEEALDEIDHLEAQLSLYRPSSQIARVNALAARERVRVTPLLFGLLKHAHQLHAETDRAFDITIAPLVRCWGFLGGTGRMPSTEQVLKARACVGMQHMELNEEDCTVRFLREGVMIDLGAIGKGYAIEQAVDLLRAAGVTSALLHGGTSTAFGLGHPPDAEAWKLAVEIPPGLNSKPTLATVFLKDESLSVSAVWGRSFQSEGKSYGHVLDPRTGYPVVGSLLSAVVLPSATETDAFSTALLVRGAEGLDPISRLRPGMGAMVVCEKDGLLNTLTRGIADRAGHQ